MHSDPQAILMDAIGRLVTHRLDGTDATAVADTDLISMLEEAGFQRNLSTTASVFRSLVSDLVRDERSEHMTADLVMACLRSAAPDSALVNVARFVENQGGGQTFLDFVASAIPIAVMLSNVFGSSQYMSDILIRHPGYLYWLMEERTWSSPHDFASYYDFISAEVKAFRHLDTRLSALRRTHRMLLLRIGVSDLSGESTVAETARRLSVLADAVCAVALDLLWEEQFDESAAPTDRGLAVLALGKLGGTELNYSSDIDLIYVCEDCDDALLGRYTKLSRRLTSVLSEVTAEGYLYRVDLRLRPDGSSGAAVYTETQALQYYHTRGRPWEFQALLKVRVIAGNREIGKRLISSLRTFAFSSSRNLASVEDIAKMRAQIKRSIPPRERVLNIKLMSGGIRDIEFILQSLQLTHGADHPSVVTTNTLEGYEKLGEKHLISERSREVLTKAYRFLRLVEHRLQMMHQIKTHSVPDSPDEIAVLARRVSCGPMGTFDATRFLTMLSEQLNAVRALAEEFFEGQDIDPRVGAVLFPEATGPDFDPLATVGFERPGDARHVLHAMAYGTFPHLHERETRTAFEQILPSLLDAMSSAPDPDTMLTQLSRMAESVDPETFYHTLGKNQSVTTATLALAAWAPTLGSRLTGDEGLLQRWLEGAQELYQLATQPVATRSVDDESQPQRIAEYRRHISAEVLASFAASAEHGKVVAGIAGALQSSALRTAVVDAFTTALAETDASVFVLGSYAVNEARINSDIDVTVVAGANTDVVEVTSAIQRANRWLTELRFVSIDFRLRGEGSSAPLVQNIDYYRQYTQTRMSSWERLAFAKRRMWVASEAGQLFDELMTETLSTPFASSDVAELRAVRDAMARLVTSPDWDTKHTVGGRYDIEYLTGVGLAGSVTMTPELCKLSTVARVDVLADVGVLAKQEVVTLKEALRLFYTIDTVASLRQVSLPRSADKSDELESYVAATLRYLNVDSCGDGVRSTIRSMRDRVRVIYDRIMT